MILVFIANIKRSDNKKGRAKMTLPFIYIYLLGMKFTTSIDNLWYHSANWLRRSIYDKSALRDKVGKREPMKTIYPSPHS